MSVGFRFGSPALGEVSFANDVTELESQLGSFVSLCVLDLCPAVANFADVSFGPLDARFDLVFLHPLDRFFRHWNIDRSFIEPD